MTLWGAKLWLRFSDSELGVGVGIEVGVGGGGGIDDQNTGNVGFGVVRKLGEISFPNRSPDRSQKQNRSPGRE